MDRKCSVPIGPTGGWIVGVQIEGLTHTLGSILGLFLCWGNALACHCCIRPPICTSTCVLCLFVPNELNSSRALCWLSCMIFADCAYCLLAAKVFVGRLCTLLILCSSYNVFSVLCGLSLHALLPLLFVECCLCSLQTVLAHSFSCALHRVSSVFFADCLRTLLSCALRRVSSVFFVDCLRTLCCPYCL